MPIAINLHLGFGKSVTRSNLAYANEVRSSTIFEGFTYHMIVTLARKARENDDFEMKG